MNNWTLTIEYVFASVAAHHILLLLLLMQIHKRGGQQRCSCRPSSVFTSGSWKVIVLASGVHVVVVAGEEEASVLVVIPGVSVPMDKNQCYYSSLQNPHVFRHTSTILEYPGEVGSHHPNFFCQLQFLRATRS